MHIVVSGSTGLIGSALCRDLMDQGHRVRRLVRPDTLESPGKAPMGTLVKWDPHADRVDTESMEGVDVVIHLAGEPLVGRWSPRKKKRILESRVQGTQVLTRHLAGMLNPPRLLLCASATGLYGDRGDEELDERSESGGGFLAEVARRWEAAADPARQAGIPTVHLRFGMVLSPNGGALGAMLPVFRLGLGGKVGDGSQYWPWISIEDVKAAVRFLIDHADGVSGPYNIVSPHPATNAEFTDALGAVLKRPTFMRMPETWITLLMGEVADQLLLASQRVTPQALSDAGFRFNHPRLQPALEALL